MKKIIVYLFLICVVCLSGCSSANLNDNSNSKPEPETVIVKETVIVTETVYVTEPNNDEKIEPTTLEESESKGYTTQEILKRAANTSEKQYWNTVCGFNLLSPNPFEDANTAHPFQSDIPLALIEVTWGRGDYIYANDTYLESVHSLGFDSIQTLERFFNDKVSLNYNPMRRLLTDAVLKNAVQEIDYISGNVLYKFRARCIAKSKALNKAMVVASLSTFREEGEIHDRGELMQYSQALYASYEHVNLVFPDRDSSIRVFSKANFQTAHQFLGLRAGIRSFSEKEVWPEDAARYRRFFDVDTLEARTADKGYIQQSFRIHDADGQYGWRQVRITKVPSVLENMYLYTIQTMSDVSIRIGEMLVRDHPEMLE